MFFARGSFQSIEAFHVRFRFLAARRFDTDAFRSRQTFVNQDFGQIFPVNLNDDVIATLTTATTRGRPTRPDRERFLQKFFGALLRLLAGFHRFIESDSEVKSLIVGSVALSKIGFGRVHIIKSRRQFLVTGANMKTIAIIVGIFDVATISELDPFFLFAGPALSEKRAQKQ